MLFAHAPCASAQCPPGAMTSIYWMSGASSRQSGISMGMAALPSGELLVLSGDSFFGPGNFVFIGAGFVFRGAPDGIGGFAWTQEAMLRAADAQPFDQAGFAVAIIAPPSGDTLAVVGSNLDDHIGADAGSAATFVRAAGGAWTQEALLVAPDAAASDNFGKSVAIAASATLLGAPEDDDGAAGAGSAYLFVRTPVGMTFQWPFQAKLTAFDPTPNAKFGSAVALLDEWAVVGSPFDDQAGGNAGAVYVFRRTPNGMGGFTWPFHSKLVAPDAQAGDLFGAALSADGGLLLIGALFAGAGETGAAYVFRLQDIGMGGVAWTHEAMLVPLPGNATSGDQVGKAVDLRDGLALLGANEDDDGGTNAGSAFLFRRTVTAGVPTWAQASKIRLPVPALTDDFGFSTAVAGGWLAVGSPAHNQYGTDRGNTFVLAAPAPPVILETPSDQTLQTGDTLLLAVAVGGRTPWTYQWFLGNTSLTNGGRFSGTDAAALAVTNVQPADAGDYRVVVTNDCGTSESTAVVAVAPPPHCPGDANGDRVVSFADVTSVLAHFGIDYSPGTGPGDANADGPVNFTDVTSVLSAWGVPCP